MPDIILFLYLVSLYVRPQDWYPPFFGLPTNDLLVPIGLIFGYFIYNKDRDIFILPQWRIMIAYLIVIFISTIIATDLGTAFEQFMLFLKRALVFTMVIWLASTPQRFNRVLIIILALSLFLAYQAHLQATVGYSWGGLTSYPGYQELRVRWWGDWDGPNVFGLLFVVASAFTLEMILGPHSKIIRLIGIALFAVFLKAIIYTSSRGAILALVAEVVFYFGLRLKTWKARVIVVSSTLFGALTILMLTSSRMANISSGESSAHERTWVWEQGLQMFRKNPIFGIGRDQFSRSNDLHLVAHNNFVQNFTESGLLGFFCFTSLLWLTFKGNLIVVRNSDHTSQWMVAMNRMMMTMIIGYSACTFFVVMENDLFYFLLGFAIACYVAARRENETLPALKMEKRDIYIILGIMFVIVFMVWLIAVKEII